jgi:hypothetical protein
MARTIVEFTAQKCQITNQEIFILAYRYYEVRKNQKCIILAFNEWMVKGTVPQHVTNYCLEVIMGRVDPRAKLLKASFELDVDWDKQKGTL